MPNYRRLFIPGGSFFFTVVTYRRRAFLTDPRARGVLRQALATVRQRWPFEMPAIVLLPDHLHAIWTLPAGDRDYSVRWKRIKEEFTVRYLAAEGTEGAPTPARLRRRERGIWQRRFWEHALRDDDDLERHFDYIHYNPVKHGLVRCPRDWRWSSFDRWVRRGWYTADWGCANDGPLRFGDLDKTAME